MSNDQQEFEQFMRRREQAAGTYIRGDARPLGEIAAQRGPASFFAPRGGFEQGAEQVWRRYERDAGSFEQGSEGELTILHMAASGGLAYWVGFQRAMVRLKGRAEPVMFNLRITELFRREGDDWKLIHRHADPLVEAAEPGK